MLPEIRSVVRGLRRRPAAAGRRAGRRRARRPAGGAVRADLLRARRGEVHLRHGQLPADEHRAPSRSQSTNGLLTTVGYQIGDEPPVYALEGSIAVTGALVQWLRDNLGLIGTAPEIETLAAHRRRQRRLLLRARPSPGCSRRTGAATRAASSPASPATSPRRTSPAPCSRPPRWQTREVVDAMNARRRRST